MNSIESGRYGWIVRVGASLMRVHPGALFVTALLVLAIDRRLPPEN